MNDIIQLPLTKSEYHYAQHCIAFYEAVQENDIETLGVIATLLRENDLYHQSALRTALARKMNELSLVAFKDSTFHRKG